MINVEMYNLTIEALEFSYKEGFMDYNDLQAAKRIVREYLEEE